MPDFDIDFCQHGRDRVITYVKERHGKDAVSQIATFGTMAARLPCATWAACSISAMALSTAWPS
jgi:DNA polymerase III alpha subunit